MRYLGKAKNHVMTGFLVLAAALFLFAVNPLEVNAYIQTQGTVVSDSAVIRKEANANSNVIASIMKGDKVTINNEETDADGVVWYKVFVDANTLGYVRGDLIQKEGSSGTTTTTTNTSTNTSTNTNTSTTANTDTNTSNSSGTGSDTTAASETPAVNTDAAVGANTTVTPVQSLGASVTGDTVRVRADASTNASIVTTVQKSTAITVNGQADGEDGKVWYRVSFIVDGKDVSGFIRSDFVQLSGDVVVIDESTPAEEPQQEPEAPVEEPALEETVNNDFDLKYETNEEGINDWYLYNNTGEVPVRNKLSEILEAADGNGDAIEVAAAQLKKQKMVIIILAIVLVFLALAVTLLLFKVRDMYYDDFDNFDEEPEQPQHSKNPVPRTVKPVQGERPAARPAGGQSRPAGSQQRAQGGQSRPAGNQNRPAGSQQRAQGGQSRPAGNQNRPAGSQQRPQGGQSRPAGNQNRPVNSQQHPKTAAPSDAGWKAKNFMAEDDDFEFEFLNWDGEEK